MEGACADEDRRPVDAPGIEAGEGRVGTVVVGARRPRRRAHLDEEEAEPLILRPLDVREVDSLRSGSGRDEAAERRVREPRHPGGGGPEPRQPDGDVQLRACRPELELARLFEALAVWRRKA